MAEAPAKPPFTNGGRAHPLPTSDRTDRLSSKPNTFVTSMTNTPDPVLYGLSFIMIIFGLTFLIVGSVYTKQCKLQPMLPMWLLIMGLIIGLGGVWHGIFVMRIKKEPFRKVKIVEKILTLILFLFFLGWFAVGNVWVYKAWGTHPDYAHYWFQNGCNKSVFIMSFITIIVLDGIVGLLVIGFCFWGVTKVVVRE